jgi:hypothetical protein
MGKVAYGSLKTMRSLFDDLPRFDRDRFAGRLSALADQKIFIGASSWKYLGWLDQIYSRDRYTSRGRFAKKRFEPECLAEYAEVFSTVCGDFAFYQFPSPEFQPVSPSAAALSICTEDSRTDHAHGVCEACASSRTGGAAQCNVSRCGPS